MNLTIDDFRHRIEYSLCQQFASADDLKAFCERARSARVGVACLNPVWVKLGSKLLSDTDMDISCNVGFPFGSHFTEVKVMETKRGIADGATQIDMVINVGALRSNEDNVVLDDIRAVVEAAEGKPVKTIIETWVLTTGEKQRACRIAEEAGAHLVKTTTGVRTQYLEMMNKNPKGAVLEDIVLMRKVLSDKVRIKASGGIYDLDYALELIKGGADQLGVSRGEELIREFGSRYGNQVEV
ncbi:MAG TPA: deoxyribose-phosphate aldolase [Spirochaetota bacterium]|nr:deoxyribose-phosphate aldolase [Spirochaetota bacterium]